MTRTHRTLGILFTFVAAVGIAYTAYATSYLTRVSDLLSSSVPGSLTNQTITFTLTQAVPANGAIELLFNEGGFTIPVGMNFVDLDVSFSANPTGPFTDRALHQVQTAGTDDITVTSGTNGKIRIDLNTSVGIPAGNTVKIEIGQHATFGAQGVNRMTLSAATSSYPVTIYTYNASDQELDYGRTLVAVIEQVTVGPVDTDDVTPPVILDAQPSGLLQVGTRAVQMWVITDELTKCRWATTSVQYSGMPYNFTSTSTFGLAYWNFATYSGLEDDTDYEVYISCEDFRQNRIEPPYLLEFTVGIVPGSASSTATSTSGTGTGTGSSTATSSCVGPDCTGTGTGSGTGASGSGSGSSPTGGDGSGSSSGGGGGSGSGTGTKLPQASVAIDGWAYPGSTIHVIQDGVSVSDFSAGSGGVFDELIEGLDRGSYSFGLYAVDSTGVRSATYATTLWLRSDTLNQLSNVMLPPTLTVPETTVQPGSPITVTGYTASNANVTVWLRPKLAQVSTGDVIATTTAATNGAWTLTVPTEGVPVGTYELVAQAAMPDGSVESDKSARKTIGVGVEVARDDCKSTGDLNCDGSVNLVDFSILLFNWASTAEVADINSDGTVSLPDFSIMLFYWTG